MIPEKTHRQRDCTDPRGTCEGCAPFAYPPYAPKFERSAVMLEADARALWAVRVLDAWAAKLDQEWALRGGVPEEIDRYTCCVGYPDDHEFYEGPTPDAARIAAAGALVAADPSLDHDAPREAPREAPPDELADLVANTCSPEEQRRRIDHAKRMLAEMYCEPRDAPREAPRCDNPECGAACKRLHPNL